VIVLVTGSRRHASFKVANHIQGWVKANADQDERIIIVHGGADGADNGASLTTVLNKDWGEFRLPARWDKSGRRAGPIRNREMVDYMRPDVCLAYPLPDSIGTYSMIDIADQRGIPVHVFEEDVL